MPGDPRFWSDGTGWSDGTLWDDFLRMSVNRGTSVGGLGVGGIGIGSGGVSGVAGPALLYDMNFAAGDPLDADFTHTRATAAWRRKSDGLWEEVGSGVLRFHHDAAGVALGVLCEGQRTNSLLDSRDVSTANWPKSTVNTQDQTGIDGVANKAWTIEDDDGAGFELIRQDITVADNSNKHTASVFIKKDNDETRFPVAVVDFRGGTTELDFEGWLNTKTGAIQPGTDATAADIRVEDAGSWWRLAIAATNNSTGNTTLRFRIFPAGGTTIGTFDTAATGSIVYDFGQVELNAGFASSPIETSGTTVTRNADVITGPSFTEQWSAVLHGQVRSFAVDHALIGSGDNNGDYTQLTAIRRLQYLGENLVAAGFANTNGIYKAAFGSDRAVVKIVLDGGTVGEKAATTPYTGPIQVGQRVSGEKPYNGTIEKLQIFDGLLSEAAFQAETV